MIAAMPEAHKYKHKSEPYVALCIKDFSNLVLSLRIRKDPYITSPHETTLPENELYPLPQLQ